MRLLLPITRGLSIGIRPGLSPTQSSPGALGWDDFISKVRSTATLFPSWSNFYRSGFQNFPNWFSWMFQNFPNWFLGFTENKPSIGLLTRTLLMCGLCLGCLGAIFVIQSINPFWCRQYPISLSPFLRLKFAYVHRIHHRFHQSEAIFHGPLKSKQRSKLHRRSDYLKPYHSPRGQKV